MSPPNRPTLLLVAAILVLAIGGLIWSQRTHSPASSEEPGNTANPVATAIDGSDTRKTTDRSKSRTPRQLALAELKTKWGDYLKLKEEGASQLLASIEAIEWAKSIGDDTVPNPRLKGIRTP